MSRATQTTYYCDNEDYCSSEAPGSQLPREWFAVTFARGEGKQAHRHYCSLRCLLQAAAMATAIEKVIAAVEQTPASLWEQIERGNGLP